MNDEARALFPRGLTQPEAGYRFSLDALLLAAFAPPLSQGSVVDLGCGCGVVGLAYSLRHPEAELDLVGLDRDATLLACARENARRLGLADHFQGLEADVRQVASRKLLPLGSHHLVLCNPPYRSPGQGRVSPEASRAGGRFCLQGELADFAQAAAHLLRTRGRAAFVYLAESLPDLLAALSAVRLTPKRLRLVHSRPHAPAATCLVEAVRHGRNRLTVEPPLVLYGPQDQGLSPEALAFCPWLTCNPRRAGHGPTP